jgi:hypothetical protein
MPWQKGQSGNPAGARPEVIEVREVRRLAQAKTKEAYAVIESLMVGAEKDSVRLAAALAVLKIAGMNLAGPVTVNVNPPAPPPPAPDRDLEAGLGPRGTMQ